MKKIVRRILSIALTAALLLSGVIAPTGASFGAARAFAEGATGSPGEAYAPLSEGADKIEVVVSADVTANNLDLSGTDALLRDELAIYGVPPSDVLVNTTNVSYVDNTFDWIRIDHTGFEAQVADDGTNLVQYYRDPYITQTFDTHIVYSESAIDFYGYGIPAFKDFLFMPNATPDNKVFSFTL
ncbi:MAG: hypothetical protein LBU58_09560, partial [Clostridiales bacterium]|nr:hypothetical protein [Clostridiales bacterium]